MSQIGDTRILENIEGDCSLVMNVLEINDIAEGLSFDLGEYNGLVVRCKNREGEMIEVWGFKGSASTDNIGTRLY